MPLEGNQIAAIVVSAVALVVSSTALLWSTLQLIHSYLGSAKGYSNINDDVMPGWVKFKKRVFLKDQFRFGVKYDTPIFVVCPVHNTRFPIDRQTPFFIGDRRDQADRMHGRRDDNASVSVNEKRKWWFGPWRIGPYITEEVQLIPPRENIPDSEVRIHTVKAERATWITLLSALEQMELDSHDWNLRKARENNSAEPPAFNLQTLAVAIQRYQRSWDNMPSSITKPYATSTMCHIIEMAAMLGLHWKEFDRARDNFLAEGNGYVLKSTSVSELGTVFTFQVRGSSKFEGNRTIPVEEVKDLAFGFAPTIYHDNANASNRNRLTALSADELKDLKFLQMGSANELAETLVSLGCNTHTSELIRKKDTNQRHLYPLAFEVLGMLCKVLHIRNSFFRTLPNPTFYQWDVRYFNMSNLLLEFRRRINDPPLQHINDHFHTLQNAVQAVGASIDNQRDIQREHRDCTAAYLVALHNALDTCDNFLREAQSGVRQILSEHIQLVLSYLNPETPNMNVMSQSLTEDKTDQGKDKPSQEEASALAFAKLNSAPLGDKEKQLMDLYFDHVLPRIPIPQSTTANSYNNERKINIWCVLVFRSLCWLLLHDFHKNDRQPEKKSELMGSRLPVYII